MNEAVKQEHDKLKKKAQEVYSGFHREAKLSSGPFLQQLKAILVDGHIKMPQVL